MTAFISIKLVNLLVNMLRFPKLQTGTARQADLSGVALLVPMRDEVARLRATITGLLDSGTPSITFLDDGSTDGSADFVRAAALQNHSQAIVLTGMARPPLWAGKTWACAQLAETALATQSAQSDRSATSSASDASDAPTEAELLVFCDADVQLAPGAITSAVAEMRRQNADVFSVFPGQEVQRWPERILIPLIDNTLLCFLPFPLLDLPIPSAATANGSLLIFTVAAYRQLDAFTAVKDALVEDVSIARLTRSAGLRLGLALGGDKVRVRMFTSFDELIRGMGRGLSPLADRHRFALIAGWTFQLVAYSLPPLLAPGFPLWRLVLGLGITERMLIEAKTGGRDWFAALQCAVGPVLAVPVVLQALRRTQTWKGRTY